MRSSKENVLTWILIMMLIVLHKIQFSFIVLVTQKYRIRNSSKEDDRSEILVKV
eukprot:UN17280